MSRRLLVLGWHNIEPTWSFHGTSADAGRRGFERQVELLRRWASVVPLDRALGDLEDGRPLPSRAVALTFDDGYLDNATFAAPLLQKAGLTATFFLTPDFLSGTVTAWWEELGRAFAEATAPQLVWEGERHDTSRPDARRTSMARVGEQLKNLDNSRRNDAIAELSDRLAPAVPADRRRLFMNWDEAATIPRLGHSIGSHTCDHPILSREEPAEQDRQLVESRRALERGFGRAVDLLAYPNGRECDYSATTVELVRRAGYRYAVTTRAGFVTPGASPHAIRRLVVDPATRVRTVVRELARVRLASGRLVGRGADGGPASDPQP